MKKKRGKNKVITKKAIKEAKAVKTVKKALETQPLNGTLHELEILAEEKKVEDKITGIEKKEAKIIEEEKKLEKETEKVEELEKEIKEEVVTKPLERLSIRDLNKGVIGAFIGVVAHFGFIYGKAIAKYISTTRATLLMLFSYLLILMLMYETGYRQIKEKRLFGVLPKRATLIYITSLIMIIIIFFMFNMIDLSDPVALYKEIAVTSVLASLGAGTADLIGRE